jgi:hypothetical protein
MSLPLSLTSPMMVSVIADSTMLPSSMFSTHVVSSKPFAPEPHCHNTRSKSGISKPLTRTNGTIAWLVSCMAHA